MRVARAVDARRFGRDAESSRRSALPTRREGMTLLEVVLAMAIFLTSLLAISRLFDMATDQAMDIQLESRATRLAQSKLAEYVSGVRSLSGGAGSGDFSEEQEPDWNWQATTDSDGAANGLYLVTITVSREVPGKGHVETSLTQYVLDPQVKGNIPAPATSSSSGSTTSSGSSSGTTGGASSTGGN